MYFFRYLWNYTSVLLSKSPKINVNRLSERLLSGVWLISCTVLLAAFAGLVRNQLLRPDPIYWIDSLQDLYEWKELQIQTFRSNYLFSFIGHTVDDPIADNFGQRLEVLNYYPTVDSGEKDINDIDYSGIVEGRTALVTTIQTLTLIKYRLTNLEEEIDYHISKNEEVSQSIHFWTNGVRLNQSMFDKINMV